MQVKASFPVISVLALLSVVTGCGSQSTQNVNVDPVSGSPVRADPTGKNPLYPSGVEGTRDAFADLEKCKVLIRDDKLDEALKNLDQVRNELPSQQSTLADYYVSLALIGQGKFEEASRATSIGAQRGALDAVIALVELEKGNKIGQDLLNNARIEIKNLPKSPVSSDSDPELLSDRSVALYAIAQQYVNDDLGDALLQLAIKESPDSPSLQFAVLSAYSDDAQPDRAKSILELIQKNKSASSTLKREAEALFQKNMK